MRVAVIGAGFGGLNAARAFKGVDVDVTLIDRNNFHTFQPLLYQVATAGLNAADVAHPVRGVFWNQANVAFRHASVTGVDWDEQLVEVDDGEPVPYDGLILAAGAGTNFFGVPGAAEHSLPLSSVADSLALRNHLLSRVEWADVHPDEADAALTWVIVGGGPTGVEMAGALAELVHHVLRKDFPDLDLGRRSRIVLVELADRLLTPFAPKLSANARHTLEKRGVGVLLDQQVESVEEDAVTLAGGERIPTDTVVWAAGVKANALVERLGLPLGPGGRIVVEPTLGVPGHPNVYAVGDVAVIPGEDGRPLPGVAQVAMQSGRHAARQLTRTFGRAGSPEPFHYKNKGIMATIGRRAAVAQFPNGFTLRGTLGWWSWLGLHLVYLIGFRNRLSVLVNWTWNYFTWDRGPRLILWADRPRRRR
ncbi:MAG TPA: NAD(P)/FAD-dependent oxidoreductase [Acidimicrobiales bacterium]